MRAGWMQVLPGAPQTTPRGQLWAFIFVLTHTRGPLLFFCRLLGARYRFPRKPPSLPVRAIGETLESNWSSRDQQRLQCGSTSRGQPCHCSRRGRTTRSTPLVLGNNMADSLARMSADSLKCDEAQVLLNTQLEQLASYIRQRGHLVNLAAHQVEPAERAPRERPWPRPKEWLLQETTHTLSKTDNHYHCESCHATVSQDRLNAWLQQGPCPALLDAPIPVAIGRGALHESHTLTFLDDRRTWLCTACGHISRLRVLWLAQPCPRVLSKAGRRNMIAIQNGRKLD